MEALRIIARFRSPMVLPEHPIALDGLLGDAVARLEDRVAGFGELVDLALPLQRSACGRYWLASVGHYTVAKHETGHIHKRAPIAEMMAFGGPKVRRMDTGTGPDKQHRIPMAKAHIHPTLGMRWWCVGERDRIEELLGLIDALGKKRGVGHGLVSEWLTDVVEPWEGFPVLRPDGCPMRNLPIDAMPSKKGARATFGQAPLQPPYWNHKHDVDVVMPPDVEWYGPERLPWYVTDHALERFVERYGRATGCRTRHEALTFIADDALASKPTERESDDGTREMVGRQPWRIRYVLGKPPEHVVELHGDAALPALVTVKSR